MFVTLEWDFSPLILCHAQVGRTLLSDLKSGPLLAFLASDMLTNYIVKMHSRCITSLNLIVSGLDPLFT